jgi:hypothetical protein
MWGKDRPEELKSDPGRLLGEGKTSGGESRAIKKFQDARRKEKDDAVDQAQVQGPGQTESYFDLKKGVSSSASAERLGDSFRYAIDHAVTLPRQKSALLPVITTDVGAERVSVYNEGTHARFPLLGVVFRNTTGNSLTQGPITVYDGATYAGDARILDLQKGEKRLLSYAVDLGTEVVPTTDPGSGTVTSLRAVKGVVRTTTKGVEKKTYTAVNRGTEARTLVIEHPRRDAFALTSKDKPWETARDVYRFKVSVPAGKTVPFTVGEESVRRQEYNLTSLDDNAIRVFLKAPVVSPAVRQALEQAMSLRGRVADTQRDLQQVEKQLQVITQDQERLRKNIKELPPEAAAFKRYLKKFDDQESEIEKLQTQQKKLQEEVHARQKEYEDYLANLTVE